MKKTKLKWKRIILVILIISIIIISSITIYNNSDYGKLRKLNYPSSVIKLMNGNLKENLIKEDEYSEFIVEALKQKLYSAKNLDYYLELEYINDKNYIEYINQLIDLKYTKEDLKKITEELETSEMKELIKVGYVNDISSYIDISYFNINYLERYIAYKIESEKSYTSVITYVNIGLDKEYYDDEIVTTETDPDSILVWVNKYKKLDDKYAPNDLEKISAECSTDEGYLRKEAKEAFEDLCAASVADGQSILASSAYRSYDDQQSVWDTYMNLYGSSYTYGYVAKPGYSEHQTGLAIDVSSGKFPDSKFAYTSDYTWTINNAYKYGFILRYGENQENITGYNSEPWHIRYVGAKVATHIYNQDITFDEYMATH